METLPTLLAGPIVRRVEQSRVCIWLASSEKPDFTIELHSHNQLLETQKTKAPAYQLGKNASLWVTLLQAFPKQGESFPLDQLIQYKIYDKTKKQYLDLSDVSYADEETPSFIISSTLKAIAYGSCRKPHGFSENEAGIFQKADSLTLLGQELKEHLHDVSKRPSTLCLIGDQIYADDVLDPVITLIQQQIALVFDEDINLPNHTIDQDLTNKQRTDIKKSSGLSSTSRNNHLLSFGEYAAMYLLVFGNQCGLSTNIICEPDNDLPTLLKVLNRFSPKAVSLVDDLIGLIQESNKDYKKAEESLKHFIASLGEVRRVFANIPTYMIFDDHDVSDDWNITRLWYDNIRASQDGTRIVSNALAAYWAFQGWGNDPDQFSDEFLTTIEDYLHDPNETDKAKRFDFSMWKAHCWSYNIPTTPPILAIDSRTQRDFGGYNDPPQLLSRYGTDQLRGDWLRLNRDHPVNHTPLIITPTPVFGYSPIEKLQKLAYAIGLFFGNQTGKFTSNYLDLESWVANKQGFSSFLTILTRNMELSNVVFLSGDVHYSFVHQGQYTAGKDRLEYTQLTSSSQRNTPKKPRFLSPLLSHKINTRTQGPINPENLPWWERIFYIWKLFKRDHWTAEVRCTQGCDLHKQEIDRTNRPNIGILYFENAEISHQTLLSGDNRESSVVYDFKPITQLEKTKPATEMKTLTKKAGNTEFSP